MFILLVVTFESSIFTVVTASFAMVVAIVVVPEPVTSHVKVIVVGVDQPAGAANLLW